MSLNLDLWLGFGLFTLVCVYLLMANQGWPK
jgi:hypothetical protein